MLENDLIQTGLYPAIFGKQHLENHIKPASESLNTYAIVDGAKLRTLFKTLEQTKPAHKILYTGYIADELEAVAPYLIELTLNDKFTDWLLSNGYAARCMCFIKSQSSLNELAEHFRNYTLVNMEQTNPDDPETAFYAFYDPKVFPAHMAGMTAAETATFFEPVTSYWCEDINQSTTIVGYYPGTIYKCHQTKVDLQEISKKFKIKQQLAQNKSTNTSVNQHG
ncbi:MAG: DUF4123 domain-containing protein [Thiohalomonadales bacterium]